MKNFKKITQRAYFKPFLYILLILVITPLGYTFTRYIMDKINDYYLESRNFYFNSNRLKGNNTLYKINNWSGVGDFNIEITVNSRKNNILASDFDVTYNISYTCGSGVICSSDKNNGVIYTATHEDSFTVTITPTKAFADGESTTVHIEATSTAPYVETISADFEIVVGKRGISYFIDDEVNRPYLLVSITNALTYYTVKEAFETYQVGDQIDSIIYNTLSPTDKAKCASATITLSFDPNDILLDITSSIFNVSTTDEVLIGGVYYVNELTFPMDAMSSLEVRFYKIDHTENYTYPFDTATSIVTFSAQ